MKILLYLLVVTMLWAVMPTEIYAAQPREIPYAHALSRATGSRNPDIAPLDRESREANAHARELLNMRARVTGDEAEALYGQYLMAIAERNRLQRERDRVSYSVELALRNLLAGIAGYELDIYLLENNLATQERMLEQTRLRRYHGMASDLEVREAEHTLEQAGLNLDMLRLTLANERQRLNRMIYQPITADIRIVYGIHNLAPIPEGTAADRFVRQQIALDHNLLYWQEEVGIRRHEWQRQLDDPNVDNSYMRLQHQLAMLERNMAERQAELNIRNALVMWDQLLEEEAALEADLAQAQEDYENMQTRLEAGLVTQIQVDAMALALATQEAALVRHQYAFWIARLRIDHPYIR